VEARAGATLREVLSSVGFSRDYLRDRVQTIFLDGSAVDDPDAEIVTGGSVIALSAALPGLEGAIFRKESAVSPMWSRTAKQDGNPGERGRTVFVTMKLFNLVAEEMGPVLMREGIIVKRSDLHEEFRRRNRVLQDVIIGAELDGKAVSLADLLAGELPDHNCILLRIT